jgi:NTE family protein
MFKQFEELILGSGGIKGIAFMGALKELSNHYPIEKFKYYTGCSIGGLISLLLNIGYTINELNNIILDTDFSNFQELKIVNFIEKCGFDEGLKFFNYYKALLINKKIDPNITFKELYEKTNKVLTTISVNITKGIPEYHNYINNPDMSVLLAIRMTTNIPILFSPILYNDNYYVDGALLDPLPYLYHTNLKKIGIAIYSDYEFHFMNNNNVNFINELNNTFQYILDLLKILHINYSKYYYKKMSKDIIYLNFDLRGDINTFDLTVVEKKKMIHIGIKKTRKFFYKLYLKKRKYYLSKKYFKIWIYKTFNNQQVQHYQALHQDNLQLNLKIE